MSLKGKYGAQFDSNRETDLLDVRRMCKPCKSLITFQTVQK